MEEIKTLLNKFYDGQTSAAEEKRLHDYFSRADVPADMEDDKRLFSALQRPSEGFEKRLSRQIDTWNMIERTTERRSRTINLKWLTGIAASLLVVVSAGIYLNGREPQNDMAMQTDTYSDPRDAYNETQKALTLFSEKLNKGLGTLENKTENK